MWSAAEQKEQLFTPGTLQEAGGPKIPVRFGRVDVGQQTGCAKEGKLPGNAQVTVSSGLLSLRGCVTTQAITELRTECLPWPHVHVAGSCSTACPQTLAQGQFVAQLAVDIACCQQQVNRSEHNSLCTGVMLVLLACCCSLVTGSRCNIKSKLQGAKCLLP